MRHSAAGGAGMCWLIGSRVNVGLVASRRGWIPLAWNGVLLFQSAREAEEWAYIHIGPPSEGKWFVESVPETPVVFEVPF